MLLFHIYFIFLNNIINILLCELAAKNYIPKKKQRKEILKKNMKLNGYYVIIKFMYIINDLTK